MKKRLRKLWVIWFLTFATWDTLYGFIDLSIHKIPLAIFQFTMAAVTLVILMLLRTLWKGEDRHNRHKERENQLIQEHNAGIIKLAAEAKAVGFLVEELNSKEDIIIRVGEREWYVSNFGAIPGQLHLWSKNPNGSLQNTTMSMPESAVLLHIMNMGREDFPE